MKFLELRQKDVINCNTGECLGFVLDLEFEIHTGKICYLIVPKTTKMLICVGKNKVYKIPYKCIVRIGRDTILVDINEKRMPEIKEKLSFLQKNDILQAVKHGRYKKMRCPYCGSEKFQSRRFQTGRRQQCDP